jgi:hypothetical protein
MGVALQGNDCTRVHTKWDNATGVKRWWDVTGLLDIQYTVICLYFGHTNGNLIASSLRVEFVNAVYSMIQKA